MIGSATLCCITLLCALEPSPKVQMMPVGLADARWTTGFWADRFETCHKALLPAMTPIMLGTERSQFLHNFRIAAGMEVGQHRGPAWNDGDLYKWLEALAGVYAITKDPNLHQHMEEVIAVLAKAQRADGYLHTPVLIANRNGQRDVKPFQDRLNFEMYNLGHLCTAACVHYRATGQRTLLDVAIKAADFLCTTFEQPTPELARNAVCPSHYMGMIDLYRVTQEKKYLALAVQFLDMRDLVTNGGDDNQDRIPFRKQTEAVGHAVRANYLYAGAADVYAETGDKTLLEPLVKIWSNVVTRKMYITGACGALYDGASPDGIKDQKQISRVHQAYGRNYQLPNSTAHNETCASIGNALWNWRMLQITGEAKYADVLERVLYNALLAGVSLDGQRFFYTNTLRQLETMPTPLRWSRQREEWISCYCCPPNVARLIAQTQTFAYSRSPRGIWVHLYGGSQLDTTLPNGQPIQLKQETDYPWDGRIKITIQKAPNSETSLYLRIPRWAAQAKLVVNQESIPTQAAQYVELRRCWKAGDQIELDLPLKPRLIEAHPLVEELRNQMAVEYGPLVYCLESLDLPASVRLTSIHLPYELKLTPRFDRTLLQGIIKLEGHVQSRATSDWSDELYREYQAKDTRTIHLQLIPYYAWGNRGKSEMSVWLPLGR